jgi:hypothetical protein
MYKALAALKPSSPTTTSGAEVTEIAVCLAIGERDPVILAYPARGACIVRKPGKKIVEPRMKSPGGGRLAASTISAIAALFNDSEATAVVCVGKLEAQQDYRSAFSFAARHKLPILFLVANTCAPGRPRKLDLRTLDREFGIPVFSIDANDAIAAFRVATEALHNARHQRGPCIIEALTGLNKSRSAVIALDLLRDYMERHENWPL